MIDRRTAIAGLGCAAAAPALARPAAPDPVPAGHALNEPAQWVALWPGTPAGAPPVLPDEQIVERSADPARPDRIMQSIAAPRMAVFRPASPNGAAVLIAPGGGYRHVVIDKEGFEMGRWLAARGVTAFVLFYRLPHQGWAAGPGVALADAQRALRLIRRGHAAYGIDPERISVMGFSAGGHVAASLATRFAAAAYAPLDSADAASARPDGAALIYLVISMRAGLAHPGSRERLLGADPPPALELAHSPDANVPADAPPCFMLHAEDDDVVPVGNALAMREGLKARGIVVDTHLYAAGGHGFGISRAAGKPVAVWPEAWLAWARAMGLA
ncbi:MAG: alpha/beta hydrolase [Erythrobacter sp.]|uniref:alpha/beta hydrolase n=1 Tax=Erythrobacter sp. TaxID=1042 RepID=UPI0025F85256|nr:alpha/beta hydrolase [Erythrobacter sp.]MCL9998872.1 alpha/beta hydrolase [Erythrobacter sp.]